MSANSLAHEGIAISSTSAPVETQGMPAWHADVLGRLFHWFSVEFELVDGETGRMLHRAAGRTSHCWDARGPLCRAVAGSGRAAFIEEDEPLIVMAVPLPSGLGTNLVAVGTFVTSHAPSPDQIARAAETLGLEPDETAEWISRQICWMPEMLLRMGQLACVQLVAEQRLRALDHEIRDLSLHLSTSYEEISLLYRLTQNLKLSSRDEELATLALEWLAEVLPAESLAVQLAPSGRINSIGSKARQEPVLLTRGPCPLSCADVTQIIEHFKLVPGQRPLVVNRRATAAATWRWPAARELILVALCEGDHCFGWLVACNHNLGGEFGTVEAGLLSSVAAILGIHSGNSELYQQQREFFAGVVRALTSAIDAKDPYTCGHSDRVARVAVRLAEELGCDQKQLDAIYLAGLLHDVGKIGIDDDVLRKPGKLTEAEYEHIKTHPEIGYKILSDIQQLEEVLPVVLHHHEQWDGKGYPRGLAGEAIPLLARILAVADSFDAMGSDRPYRQGMDEPKLDAILRGGSGTQWDATVVAAFFHARDAIREIAHEKAKNLTLDLRDQT